MSLRTGGTCSSHSAIDAVIAEADRQQSEPRRGSKRACQQVKIICAAVTEYSIHPPTLTWAPARERYSSANIGQKSPRVRYSICSHCQPVSAMRSISSALSGASSKGCTRRSTWPMRMNKATYLASGEQHRQYGDRCGRPIAPRSAPPDKLIGLQKEQVRLPRSSQRPGLCRIQPCSVCSSQLASNEATIPQLEQKASQSDHLLVALTGHTPTAMERARGGPDRAHAAG